MAAYRGEENPLLRWIGRAGWFRAGCAPKPKAIASVAQCTRSATCWRNRSRVSTVLPGLRCEGFETAAAISEHQSSRVCPNRYTFGSGNVVVQAVSSGRRHPWLIWFRINPSVLQVVRISSPWGSCPRDRSPGLPPALSSPPAAALPAARRPSKPARRQESARPIPTSP